MAIRLLHTADWQLGKRFAGLPGDKAPLLREARFEAVRTMARLARRAARSMPCSWRATCSTTTSSGARRWPGPWRRCASSPAPGSSCPATTTPPRRPASGRGSPAGAARERAAREHARSPWRWPTGCVVLPAPLTAAQPGRSHRLDRSGSDAGGRLRVGLAHGAVAGRLPAEADAWNPIAADRAERARLDYLALGDWHGTLEIAARTWYAGTPEPDRFQGQRPARRCWSSSTAPGAAPYGGARCHRRPSLARG